MKPPPTINDIMLKLEGLTSGALSPEEVAHWATYWIVLDDPPDMDENVWDMLDCLMGADLTVAKGVYMFGPSDYSSWLEDFKKKNGNYGDSLELR